MVILTCTPHCRSISKTRLWLNSYRRCGVHVNGYPAAGNVNSPARTLPYPSPTSTKSKHDHHLRLTSLPNLLTGISPPSASSTQSFRLKQSKRIASCVSRAQLAQVNVFLIPSSSRVGRQRICTRTSYGVRANDGTNKGSDPPTHLATWTILYLGREGNHQQVHDSRYVIPSAV